MSEPMTSAAATNSALLGMIHSLRQFQDNKAYSLEMAKTREGRQVLLDTKSDMDGYRTLLSQLLKELTKVDDIIDRALRKTRAEVRL